MKLKRIIYGIVNLLSVLIIAAAVFVLCTVIFTKSGDAPTVFGYTALRVTTGSMKPTYDVDTMIIVKKTDPQEIKENDVISFYSQDPLLDGAVNTHRVVEIQEQDGKRIFITKGDHNNVVDSYGVEEQYLIGKVVASSKIIGKVSRLVANPLVFIPIILIPLAVILITNLLGTVRMAQRIAREEEEVAVKEAIRQIKEKKMEQGQEDDRNVNQEREE